MDVGEKTIPDQIRQKNSFIGAIEPKSPYFDENIYLYIDKMLEDPYFKQEVKKEWLILKNNLPLLYKFIDETAKTIEYSAKLNFQVWNFESIGGVTQFATWEEEIDFIKEHLNERYPWLDSVVSNW